MVNFGILGPLWVGVAGSPVDIHRPISRRLLAALIVRAPETVSVSALAETLWADDQPHNPANALQVQISYLRRTLAAVIEGGPSPIVTRPGGYALDVPADHIDARRFESLVRQADQLVTNRTTSGCQAALALLDDARSLWRGEPLTDAAEAVFALGEVTRLTELRWAAAELRHDLLLALGRHREAVSEIASTVTEQPLRERLREQLVLALYRSGRQADALRAVQSARRTLLEELGVDPGPALQRLEQQILAQDPGIGWEPLAGDEAGPGHDAGPIGPRSARREPALPVPLTPLIGREVEVARIHDLLQRNRMVTLTGPGGAGKSRLALEIAHTEATTGPVWPVDLGAVVGDELVGPTVAAALGIPIGPGDDPALAVALSVARDRPLFVFDTCEHVVAGVAELAARILGRSAGTRILATSRRAIGITGEIAWPVPPLSVAPPLTTVAELRSFASAALFCARAEAVRADFDVTESNAADIAAICLALDGLPLAIELAAARADVLTPAAIRGRLQNRFDLLVDGRREASPRQQTLRSALDWSFELLTTPNAGSSPGSGSSTAASISTPPSQSRGPDSTTPSRCCLTWFASRWW